MSNAISIQTSEQGPQGPPGPAGAGITEAHGSVHPSAPDVGTDGSFGSNNQFIDLVEQARTDVQLRISIGGIDVFGVVGVDPTAMTPDQIFMLRTDGVRVWFNDSFLVDNTDPILVTIPPAVATVAP